MTYVIRNRQHQFWYAGSWVSPDRADVFTEGDRTRLGLPPGGEWVPQEAADAVQFANLLVALKEEGLLPPPAEQALIRRVYGVDTTEVLEQAERLSLAYVSPETP